MHSSILDVTDVHISLYVLAAQWRQDIISQHGVSYDLPSLLSARTEPKVVSDCTNLFNRLVNYGRLVCDPLRGYYLRPFLDSSMGQLRRMILQTVLFAFTSLYSDNPSSKVRGLTIISVLAASGNHQLLFWNCHELLMFSIKATLNDVLSEVGGIFSFIQERTGNVSVEDTKTIIEQMSTYGILKTL